MLSQYSWDNIVQEKYLVECGIKSKNEKREGKSEP